MNRIEAAFTDIFATWDIRLPPVAVTLRQPGKINKRGWAIRYVFGEDHLDFYADHRMTNPRHVRIHSDGQIKHLEAPREMYSIPRNADERTRLQAKEDFYAYNRGVYAKLEAKGLAD